MSVAKKFVEQISKSAEIKAAKKTMFGELCEIFPLRPLHSNADHENAMRLLRVVNREIEKLRGGEIEKNCVDYVKVLGHLIHEYEALKIKQAQVTEAELLKLIMEQNGLNQADFKEEIGEQPVVSEILSGKRRLTKNHIEKLSRRFEISPAAFFTSAT